MASEEEIAKHVADVLGVPSPDAPEGMGDRVRRSLREVGLTAVAAAEVLGVTRHTVNRWIRDSEIPEQELRRVAELTNKSAPWLRYGLTDAAEVSIERYVTGYEDALQHVRQHLDRMQPPARESQ